MPAGAAVGIAAVGVGVNIQQQNQAAGQDRKARRTQQRLQDIKTARERRKQVRAARIARAQALSAGQASGTGSSSVTAAQTGTVGTQLAGNLSFLDIVQGLTADISRRNQKSADFTSRGNTAQAVGNFALQAQGTGLFD